MTGQLFQWVSPNVTQYVALALLHFLWQGALLAAAVAIILRLLRDDLAPSTDAEPSASRPHSRANARYAVACAGLLVMAVLPVVNVFLVEPTSDAVAREPYASSDWNPQVGPAATGTRQDISLTGSFSFDAPAGEAAIDCLSIDARTASAGGPGTAPSYSPWLRLILQLVFWVWLAGVAFLSAWHGAAWSLSQRFRRAGKPATSDILDKVKSITRQLGLRRAIAVRQSAEMMAPVVIGWIKPVLILPMSLVTHLSPAQFEAVLAHELAHIRRLDYLVNLIQAVVETVLFYHPAVWWLSRRIRCEREFCTDDLAMRACREREVYAQSLVALAEFARTPPAYAMAATGGRLLARIRRIMLLPDERSASRRGAGRTWLVAVAAIVCLGGVLAVAQTQAVGDSADPQIAAAAVQGEPVGSPAESTLPVVGADPFAIEGKDAARQRDCGERMVDALRQGSRVECIETPVRDILTHLASDHNINIVLDLRALDEAGIDQDVKTSRSLEGMPLARTLDFVTGDVDLIWCVRHNVVLVTTHRAAPRYATVYKIRTPVKGLREDITHSMDYFSWNSVGGIGSLASVSPNLLVIAQSCDVQRRIELRYAEELRPVPPAWDAMPPTLAGTPMADALNSVTTLAVIEMPLKDVIALLAEKHSVKMSLDQQALQGEQFGDSVPITRKLREIPLRSMLSLVLADLDLVWIADKDEIRITTLRVASQKLQRIEYPVEDLTEAGDTGALAQLLTTTVAPETWDRVGGPATIQQSGPGKLDIHQTFQGHLRISALLQEVRKARQANP